ncbi:MAG: bifunctional precorrin-2 dehydrogenase/sirohydrochlorin ferrochelatase [Deltaproteobacteria bacterium]|nr:bifunctional precorrin-2 dehydrogenase/sirohydrochlorin ferrochelatase [Deltaproteobacteria bacterium]MBW2658244.1 bifunctional precorrin-2 dehydrogenase/sirohydrochlorin ferrochelatase [Deltaproteobacteria bacterium]
MALYPVNLNIANRLCIVVGGGEVALRKVNSLLDCKGLVRIVSPYVVPELEEIIHQKRAEWFERGYAKGDLRGAFLVFAATGDPQVQQQVKEEAGKCEVMLNSANDPVGSDFHVPAHFRRGKMLVAVATGGGSPALSRKIMEKLELELGPEYEAVVDFLAMVREAVTNKVADPSDRRELFYNLLKNDLAGLVREGNWFDLQMMLLQELPPDIDTPLLIKNFLEAYDR